MSLGPIATTHVYPIREKEYHRLYTSNGSDCPCNPEVVWNNEHKTYVVVHNLMLDEEVINEIEDEIDNILKNDL